MNWKTWVPLVLAIVLGLVAAKAARDVMLKNKRVANNHAKYAKVVVTKGDLVPGAALEASDLALAQIDARHVPPGSFQSIDKVVGRVSETLMVKGQPIVEAMLAPIGTGGGLQALVPPGMRAITIEVNEFSGVAGLIVPGCRVDVIATINDGQGGEGRIAKTIVQNVKVTAVGQRTSAAGAAPQSPGEIAKSVTILASLEDAEVIELACATGRPRLVLRGGRDNQVMTTLGVSMSDLKGTGSRPDSGTSALALAPPVTPPLAVVEVPTTRPAEVIVQRDPVQRRMVRVIRGGRVSVVSLITQPQTPDVESDENLAESEIDETSHDAIGSIDPLDGK